MPKSGDPYWKGVRVFLQQRPCFKQCFLQRICSSYFLFGAHASGFLFWAAELTTRAIRFCRVSECLALATYHNSCFLFDGLNAAKFCRATSFSTNAASRSDGMLSCSTRHTHATTHPFSLPRRRLSLQQSSAPVWRVAPPVLCCCAPRGSFAF